MLRRVSVLSLLLLSLIAQSAWSADQVTAFGDSIMAGWNADSRKLHDIPGGDLVERFAKAIGSDQSNYAFPGLDSGQIIQAFKLEKNNAGRATYLLIDAGGNDYLNVRKHDDDHAKVCNAATYPPVTTRFHQNWDKLLDLARATNPSAKLRSFNLYFPQMAYYRGVSCHNLATAYDFILPALIEANYYICSGTEKHGGKCADNFAAFNCPIGIREACRYVRGELLTTYKARLLSLSPSFVDPGQAGLLQNDGIHPNSDGHELISELFER